MYFMKVIFWKSKQTMELVVSSRRLEHIDKERLILAPDRGLSFLPKKICFQKLKIMTKVAKSF